MMDNYLDKLCDELDAAIFSGDLLYVETQRSLLKTYLERWQRAVNEHEVLNETE
jgi:hypothetical protein